MSIAVNLDVTGGGGGDVSWTDQTGKSLAQAKTDIGVVISANGFGMINAHDFAAAAGAYIWDYDSMEQLVGWLVNERDVGNCEVKSWSRWWADNNGTITDRV